MLTGALHWTIIPSLRHRLSALTSSPRRPPQLALARGALPTPGPPLGMPQGLKGQGQPLQAPAGYRGAMPTPVPD